MPFSLTANDIFYAAVISVPIMMLVSSLSRVFKAVLGRAAEFNYHPNNQEAVLERCCFMFPNELVKFNGATFSRGMLVRVITINRRTFEGKLIGSNKSNVVCVLTNESVVAQGLDDIEEIKEL